MDEQPLPVPRSTGGRLLYALVTIVMPILCFLLAGALYPEWQSGSLSDYTALLLNPSISLFFAPFLVYAVVCLALLLVAPRRLARFFVVRLGIYSSFFLALQYVVLLGITMGRGKPLLIILGALGLFILPPAWAWVYTLAQRKAGAKTTRWAALVLASLVILLIGITSIFTYGVPLILAIVLVFAGTPIWCLEIAAVVSCRLLRDYERQSRLTAWHVVGPLAWLGALGVAWRFAILQMWADYATLPTQPPQCYVATAAARGHPWLVRSWPALDRAGRPVRVNRQLQRLKSAELALQATWPAGHHCLRRAYDALGPRLARHLRRPLLADLAYLLLKPAEWASWAVLCALLPQAGTLADRAHTVGDEA